MNVENTIGIFNFIELEYLATAHRVLLIILLII